jgi:hypothetical protein
MAKFEVDSTKLAALSKAAYAGEKSFTEEVEALKAVAVNGAIPKAYADAYKTAVVCAKLGLPRTKANLAEASKSEHKDLRLAAANRLSRRVKAAGISAANASGRKRGSKVVTTGTPAKHAPAAPTNVAPPLKVGKKVQAEARQATWQGVSVPELSTCADLDNMMLGLVAFARAAATANPDAVDDVNRAALMQITGAVESMNRARIEQEGDDEPNF